ncbi:hypothetical protein MTO96_040747 [Rhipicephalus appendiculatus]
MWPTIAMTVYCLIGVYAFGLYKDTANRLITGGKEKYKVTISRVLREDTWTWTWIMAAMSTCRTAGEAGLAWRLAHREGPFVNAALGTWVLNLATAATAASGFALQAVVQYKADEQPGAHAAAVAIFGLLILVARWSHALGFSVFRTPAEGHQLWEVVRLSAVCTILNVVTGCVLAVHFSVKSPETERLAGVFEWISAGSDGLLQLVITTGI